MKKDSVGIQESETTPDDLILLSTADDDIKEKHQTYCFDYDAFKRRISTGDRWQQLIQSHLYFEHVITEMLRDALPYPDEIEVSRMGFFQKLQLAKAMGLIPADVHSCIKKINSLRNSIAHDLEFEISDEDERDLFNCTPLHLREAVEEDEERKEQGAVKFYELLWVTLLQTEIFRQHHVVQRLLSRKAQIRLRMALGKVPGAVYVP